MTTSPLSHGSRSWRSSVLVLLVVLMPPLSQGLLSRDGDLLHIAASADGLTTAPAALLAAVCLYMSWRISAVTSPSWIVASLALVGVQSVSFAALQVSDPQRTAQQHGWMALADLLMVVSLLALRAIGERRALRLSPAALGAALGAVIGLLRVAAVSRLPQFEPSVAQRSLIAFAGVSMALVLSRYVVRAGGLPYGVRVRFAAAVLLLCAGHTVTALDGTSRHWVNVLVALACSMVAAGALVVGAMIMLRQGLSDHVQQTSSLLEQLEQVHQDHRHHRARMHELESTIAGIRSAGELLREPGRIAPERRRQLEEMIHSEVCRLERLLSSRQAGEQEAPAIIGLPLAPPVPAGVDLDAIIGTLAMLHEAKGTSVEWQPSGLRVAAHDDDVTEVLNILLDNAARHGDAAPRVSVLDVGGLGGLGGMVEILVSDDGPGIAPDVRDRLFQWGVKGTASPGQGIGLHIAHGLVTRHGGYLRVLDQGDPAATPAATRSGATFVVGLPAAPTVRADVRAGRASAKAGDGVPA